MVSEERMSETRKWLEGIVESAKSVATVDDAWGVSPHWTEDGSLELFLTHSWHHSTMHGRIVASQDDGSRNVFWSIGWQGHGGGQMIMEPTAYATTAVAMMVFGVLSAEHHRGRTDAELQALPNGGAISRNEWQRTYDSGQRDVRRRLQVVVVTSRLRERTEALHKAKFWVDHGSSGSDFEVLKDCLRHASSDFAGAVQDVRSLLSAIDDQDQQQGPDR